MVKSVKKWVAENGSLHDCERDAWAEDFKQKASKFAGADELVSDILSNPHEYKSLINVICQLTPVAPDVASYVAGDIDTPNARPVNYHFRETGE